MTEKLGKSVEVINAGVNGDIADEIDIVKKVMAALQEGLDDPGCDYPLDIVDTLNQTQKKR